MKLEYKGKFIDDLNQLEILKNSHFENFPHLFKQFLFIMGLNKYEHKGSLKEIEKYDLYEERQKIFDNLDKYEEGEKKALLDIVRYNSFLKSFNKNKGQWLEDYLKELFNNNTKYFQLKESNPWKYGLIHPYFLNYKIKIDNKMYYEYFFLPFDLSLKNKMTIYLENNPSNYLKNLFELNVSKYFSFHLNITSPILKEGKFTSKFSYTLDLVSNREINNSELNEILLKLNILNKSVDLSKQKTDVTYIDLKKKDLIILELKNNEKTPLTINAISQAIVYGLREKKFNKTKFKSVKVIYTGDLSEKLSSELEYINSNLKKSENFYVELVKFNDFMLNLKENYFDDESKKSYRRETFCFNLDTLVIKNKEKGDSYLNTQYKKYFEFRDNKDFILFQADFDFVPEPLNLKDIKNNKENKEKRKEQENILNKVVSDRFLKK
jgi:hypothetical protein